MEKINIAELDIKEELHCLKLGVSHFRVYNEKLNIRGHGTDFSKEVALKKALHEYVERYYFRQHLVSVGFHTTSGIAAHLDQLSSKKSAINELLERHIFLSHWLQAIPPIWIDDSDTLDQILTSKNTTHVEKLIANNFNIRFGILAKVDEIFVAISIIKKQGETGFVVSCSSDTSVNIAMEKCLIDSIRVADLIENRKNNNIKLFADLDASQVTTPEEHLEYYLNEANWRDLEWFFETSDQVRKYSYPHIETVTWTNDTILPWEVHVSFAISSEVQKLYFGETKTENIHPLNLSKLKNFKLHPFA
jgi:YcaO cyclodehydratase, ATP-ad Mg2+-binding